MYSWECLEWDRFIIFMSLLFYKYNRLEKVDCLRMFTRLYWLSLPCTLLPARYYDSMLYGIAVVVAETSFSVTLQADSCTCFWMPYAVAIVVNDFIQSWLLLAFVEPDCVYVCLSIVCCITLYNFMSLLHKSVTLHWHCWSSSWLSKKLIHLELWLLLLNLADALVPSNYDYPKASFTLTRIFVEWFWHACLHWREREHSQRSFARMFAV